MPGPRPSFDAPAWVHALSRGDLSLRFGRTSVTRAVTYQRRGAVHDLRATMEGELRATVYGSRRYVTTVQCLRRSRTGVDPAEIRSNCTCPVGDACKHGAAVILQAQASAPSPGRAVGSRGASAGGHDEAGARSEPAALWESLFSPVLAEVDAQDAQATGLPLAVLIDVAKPSAHRASALHLRPLIEGASGKWIVSGISWSDLQYGYAAPRANPRQRAALAAISRAEAAASPHWYGTGNTIDSETLGPGMWPLLRAAREAGVTLVTGRQRHPVALADPVDLALDLTRDAQGAIRLAPVADVPHASAPLTLLGNPGHGIVTAGADGMIIAGLSSPLSAPLMRVIAQSAQVEIPSDDAERFLATYTPALRRGVRVTSSDGSVTIPEVSRPRLGVEVTFEPDHLTRLRWCFRYRVGEVTHEVPLGRAPTTVPRDGTAEEDLLTSLDLLDAVPGLRVPLPGTTRPGVVIAPVLQTWATVAFVQHVLPRLQEREDIDVTVIGEPLAYSEADAAPVVRVAARDPREEQTVRGAPPRSASEQGGVDRDWFDLSIEVTVGDLCVPLADLVTALAREEERLLLPDGTWFSIDSPELDALHRLVQEARDLQDQPGQALRINRFQAGLWEELVTLGVVTEQSERWQRTVGALLALDEVPHPPPPSRLQATLREYQLDGFRWLSFLWEHELGGVLADDMGLGKTLQVLTATARAREEGLVSSQAPLLVVAPTSVVGTWQREAAKFTPHLKVKAITQTMKRSGLSLDELIGDAEVVVTSYALLRIDEEHLLERTWSAMVLDEAQAVKNHRSRTYQAARRMRAPVKFAVTGTPLENSLMDLWSLMSIVAPGLFSDPQRFSEVFRKPIEGGSSPHLLDTLRRRIRPLMLRRTKEAVADDLPPKVEQVVAVPLNAAHRRIYDTHLQRERQRILGLLDDVDRHRIAILAGLTRLRQLSLDVHLVVPDAPATARPSKVDALIERIVEVAAEGHRCLVFSQFTRFLAVVRQRLDEDQIRHVYLDGRTRDRPKRILEFTEGDAPVFLISLKAGGAGLTLTEADYVFVLDPWWNPAVEAQAVDRAHRIGQDKTVMVYRLVAEGTIEEKVVELQERKRELFAKVVDDGGALGGAVTAEDIRGLLTPMENA